MRQAFSGLLIVCALGVVSSHAQRPASRILKLEELRFPQIDALDRERTMFILPIGMLEGAWAAPSNRVGHVGRHVRGERRGNTRQPAAAAVERRDDAAAPLR
jgi:hypothetical protein